MRREMLEGSGGYGTQEEEWTLERMGLPEACGRKEKRMGMMLTNL